MPLIESAPASEPFGQVCEQFESERPFLSASSRQLPLVVIEIGQESVVVRTPRQVGGRRGRDREGSDVLERNSELHALIDDYLAKAKRLGYSPLHGWFR